MKTSLLTTNREMFKLKINRRWGLTEARAWVRLIIYRIQILVFGFADEAEIRAKASQPKFYY
jgi:hypothetical protein